MDAKDIKVCGVTADREPAGGGGARGGAGVTLPMSLEETMKLKTKKVAELNWKMFEAYREAGFTADDAVCLVARHGIKVSEYKL